MLAPTRELATQVSEACFNYGRDLGIRVVPLVGGQSMGRQLDQLRRGAHVVVGTPGRVLDHVRRGSLAADSIRTVVLDEADEMLDMGFADELEEILEAMPTERQTVLFSATLPKRIAAIADRHQQDPVRIEMAGKAAEGRGEIREQLHVVRRHDKVAALARVIDVEQPTAAIVFCRTRTEVDELTATLNGRGYRAEAIHGGIDQDQRDRVMRRLRDGSAELLVATDVAARGIDVDVLTHVFNFDVPSAPESYVHRIGRVGRAGRDGVAVTFAEPRERRQIGNIERVTGSKFTAVPVPSVSVLRDSRIDTTVTSLREVLAEGPRADDEAVLARLEALVARSVDDDGADDLDDIDELVDDADDHAEILRRIALAAIALATAGQPSVEDEPDIADLSKDDRNKRNQRDRGPKGRDRDRDRGGKGGGRGGRDDVADADKGYVMINLGRTAGVRPADLVGAIASEAGLSGRQIGPIRIAPKYSVVGVPDARVDDVVRAIESGGIRGKQARARRFVDDRN